MSIDADRISTLDESITVWQWNGAPQWARDLSRHGGDEDWVAFVPEHFGHYEPGWMESGTAFGCCDVSEHRVEGGWVYIGAHA